MKTAVDIHANSHEVLTLIVQPEPHRLKNRYSEVPPQIVT